VRLISGREHPIIPSPSQVDGPHGPVALKVHRCRWSGDHPDNSLAAINECMTVGVARAEFDLRLLRDCDFALVHDDAVRRPDGSTAAASQVRAAELLAIPVDSRPALLSEAVSLLDVSPSGTLFEIDLKDESPWPWRRLEELGAMLDPVRDRIVVAGCSDSDLRRLSTVAPELPLGFNPANHLDWVPEGAEEALSPPRRASGYLDAEAPSDRSEARAGYLRRRLAEVLALVPRARELHLRLLAFERMLDDGLIELAQVVHAAGMSLDVWTLDAGMPGWRRRATRAVAAGVDMITTNTPIRLAEALGSSGTSS
jgi:glycerophosphoryl diester phosphodiesterase